MNKNIAPSNLPMVGKKSGDAIRGIPSLEAWVSLNITWGALGIPKLRVLPILIPSSIVISLKT